MNKQTVSGLNRSSGMSNANGVLQTLLENPLTGIILVRNRKIIHVNKKMAEISGYGSDELIGNSTRILYRSDEDFNEIGRIIYSDLAKGREARFEILTKRKDGSEFWCLLSGKSVNPEETDNSDSVWIFQDIDEMKRQKEMLESNTYRAILDNSLVGIVLLQKRHIVSANKKMADLFGYDAPEEMLGNTT